ncbi:hypothetical protein BDV25DRAFT_80896 [Aspergillus avenaceus]|uniref:Zn(2)-C6 fungal-type domain-containing protein n=1 Tax=Aspergillus avenaceus TaxID=36643 RepID=A0A5N6U0C3_ASPAV|nr:hypothetical protein BDV25DRAFT_80896 [Aspergillus avenaceus]
MDDQDSPSKSTPKFKRCRTGCLRCRKRRRKCDEGKPNCQNCIDKDLDCQYGLQISFLRKNSYTVAANELHTPKSDASYDKIRFVQDPLGCATDTTVDGTDSTTEDTVCSPDSTAARIDHGSLNDTRNDAYQVQYFDGKHNTPAGTSSISSKGGNVTSYCQFPDGEITNGDNNDAVQGLLALGSVSGSNEPIAEPGFLPIFNPNVAPSSLAHTISTQLGDDTPSITSIKSAYGSMNNIELPVDAVETTTISEARRLELLRHYRYHIAPWLDICDLRHPFGITALQLAIDSDSLLSALMALSETCAFPISHGNREHLGQSTLSFPHQPPPSADNSTNLTEVVLISLFETIKFLVTDVSQAWNQMRDRNNHLSDYLVQYAYGTNIESVAYWMSLRIDLGVALANNDPPRIALPMPPIPSIQLVTRTEDTCERVMHYANIALWLCGKALIIHHQQENPHLLAASNEITQSWLQVYDELQGWYNLRPVEFQPMVEINERDQALNPGSEFPLLLFASGAGTFSNQIYHTAKLLLLQCKPRTALLNHPQSPALSPLWHAHRICGISINNDTRESWDPCLLASLLVAAKHMTHESQQQEIVQAIHRIREITGWDTGEYLARLQEDWTFLDGV